MDAQENSSDTSTRDSPGIFTALASAVLEWLLIFMLFIDACFSYLVTKFAHTCKLQTPCLLCSRLDHVLGNQRVGFYWDLICCKHKLDISSLVLCHAHSKLVDVHGICETCLFSSVTKNKSNDETYKLLVGKLVAEPQPTVDQDPLLRDNNPDSLRARKCCCCNRPWIPRGYYHNLLQTLQIDFKGSNIDKSLGFPAIAAGHDAHSIKKKCDESSVFLDGSHMESNGFDSLSHVEYKMVKVSSDTESEVPFSDVDSASAFIYQVEELKEESSVQDACPDHRIITLEENLTSERVIGLSFVTEVTCTMPEVELKVDDSSDGKSSAAVASCSSDELSLRQTLQKSATLKSSEVVSSNEAPLLANSSGTLPASKENSDGREHVEAGEISRAHRSSTSASNLWIELNTMVGDTGLRTPSSLDLGDAYKLAVGNMVRQSSGKLSQQSSLKDSSRVSGDLKLLLSQLSATRGIDLSSTDMSPKLSRSMNGQKSFDSSNSFGVHMLQKKVSLERNESGFSLDGSIISEIEGESVVDRLKRQLEHDKKLLGALYMELEEERNASAVAANQALAMITKLQEEKATLHLEALQCIRMMEEHAEYDGKALQKANTIIAENEKRIHNLEADVEIYKKKIGDVLTVESENGQTHDMNAEEVKFDICGTTENRVGIPCNQ